MISDGKYVFRIGRLGDKPAQKLLDTPDFVLEFKGKQVVAAHISGHEFELYMIHSFEWNKGYCTKFLELWEIYAKEEKCTKLVVSHVASDPLEHILLDKRDFSLEGLDQADEKIFSKKLSS